MKRNSSAEVLSKVSITDSVFPNSNPSSSHKNLQLFVQLLLWMLKMAVKKWAILSAVSVTVMQYHTHTYIHWGANKKNRWLNDSWIDNKINHQILIKLQIP